jgi:hypothetical protein
VAVIENIDVVMGAQTAELDAGVAEAVKNLETLKSAANGQTIDIAGGDGLSKNAGAIKEIASASKSLTGDSTLSAVAGLINDTTDSISKFSDVAKKGNLAAFAFQAGLVGMVAGGSFEIGKAIGEWVFETEKWNTQLKRAQAELSALGDQTRQLQQIQFASQMKDFDTIRDPAKRRDAQSAEFDRLGKELQGAEATYRFAKKKGSTEDVNDAVAQIDMINQQRDALWSLLDPRNDLIKLNERLDAIDEKNKQTRQSAIADYVTMTTQLVEIEQGKAAAQKMELERKGYNEEEIDRLQKVSREIERQKELADELKTATEDAKRIKEDSLTADERLTEEAMKLQNLKDRGLLSEEEYAKGLKNAEKKNREDTSDGPSGAVSAQAGSVAAYKLMLEREKGAEEETRKQTTIQERIAKATEESNQRLQNLVNVGNARGG